MSEALLLTFQSQLSVVMETVLKSAMFEITRLVEDSFLEEVGHRKQEVELLRRRLHLSESKLREKEDQWEQVRKSHCPDCGRPGDSSPREEIPPADTSRGLDAFSLGLRLIDQTSDQPSLASDIWSSRQKLDAFKHPASQSEEMSCASRRTEMMRQGSPAEFITTVSAAQPPLDVLHKLLGSSGVDSMSSSVCKSKSDQSETDLTFDKETDSRMLRSPLAVEANGSLEASSPNTSVKSELKLDFLPVKEEDEMIPVWESVSKDDGCDGEMADPSQEELRGACDQEEIQTSLWPREQPTSQQGHSYPTNKQRTFSIVAREILTQFHVWQRACYSRNIEWGPITAKIISALPQLYGRETEVIVRCTKMLHNRRDYLRRRAKESAVERNALPVNQRLLVGLQLQRGDL